MPADVATRRLNAAQIILDDFRDLEVAHHGAGHRDYVQLSEMGDPDLARGNCWIITSELIEQVSVADFGAYATSELTINGRGQHVALLVDDGDGAYIVDYTARQFSPNLPFPFVAGYNEWKASIEAATGVAWTLDDVDNDECEFCGEEITERSSEGGVCEVCAEP